MMEKEFVSIYNSPLDIAREWKKDCKGKVVGYLCSYFPEEILHAAGILPYRIMAGMYACSIENSALDIELNGKYDFLDGIIVPQTCDRIMDLYSIWKRNSQGDFFYSLPILSLMTGDSVRLFEKELGNLVNAIENKLTGNPVSEKSLCESIKLYNHMRRLFLELDNLRQQGSIEASVLYEAILASMTMRKEECLPLLEALASDAAPLKDSTKTSSLKVHLSGTVLYDIDLVRLIESFGIQVVSDDLCTGSRYYLTEVDELKPPLAALAERYLSNLPCSCVRSEQLQLGYIREAAQKNSIDGVVVLLGKYCTSHLQDDLDMKKGLDALGFPVLFLEVEQTNASQEQLKTRLQAFAEIISK